jgi:hypothetical protein
MQKETKISALNRKSQTPEFIIAELGAQLPELEMIMVTAKFKDGSIGTLSSSMSAESLALLKVMNSVQVDRILEDIGTGLPEEKL